MEHQADLTRNEQTSTLAPKPSHPIPHLAFNPTVSASTNPLAVQRAQKRDATVAFGTPPQQQAASEPMAALHRNSASWVMQGAPPAAGKGRQQHLVPVKLIEAAIRLETKTVTTKPYSTCWWHAWGMSCPLENLGEHSAQGLHRLGFKLSTEAKAKLCKASNFQPVMPKPNGAGM